MNNISMLPLINVSGKILCLLVHFKSPFSFRCAVSSRAPFCSSQTQPHFLWNDRCPPPPQTLPDRACEVPSCRSDSECERHKRCCYNGCIYACLESVQPPPVLDWLVQPKPRWLGGNGWLLDGPEEVLQGTVHFTVFSVVSVEGVGRWEVFFYETFPDVCMPEVLNFFVERLLHLLISFSQTQVVPINYPLWSYTDGVRPAKP
uniref:WAP four-disulfide core domain protein 1 n=1 Tax=Accipiter nisus TaxID=211598 RepID=A0A8B9M9Z3_9AVES